MFSSCATVFSGKLTEHQKTRPAPGEPKREIKWELVVVDAVLFFPYGLVGLGIDFATGAIYRPLRDQNGYKIQYKDSDAVPQTYMDSRAKRKAYFDAKHERLVREHDSIKAVREARKAERKAKKG